MELWIKWSPSMPSIGAGTDPPCTPTLEWWPWGSRAAGIALRWLRLQGPRSLLGRDTRGQRHAAAGTALPGSPVGQGHPGVWGRAGERWQWVKAALTPRLPPNFKDEYGQAVIAYTDNDLHRVFNAAVRAAGRSWDVYNASFPFKAMHFYLTRALQVLRGPCEAAYGTAVYRGMVHTRYQLRGASPFRFGSFASCSFRRERAESFGQDTFLSIHSCFGVPIHAFSLYTEEEEVLIPGYEIFWVFPDGGSHRFALRSTNRSCSHFNCAFLGYEKSPECRGSTAIAGLRDEL
ncbi:UNVERIFIED_CONTAM: hypothetical protein H355_012347 [Colinus virginianus]|nr:hypothetical protein H355_012347 [Colinus virginianus]